MTIIARLNSLNEAYAGIHALRSKAIVPELGKDGESLIIGVDDDHAYDAKNVLRDAKIEDQNLLNASWPNWNNFEEHNT